MTLTRKNGNNTGSLAKSLGLFGQLGAVVHVQNELLESKDVDIQRQLLGQVADPVILGVCYVGDGICNGFATATATYLRHRALLKLWQS